MLKTILTTVGIATALAAGSASAALFGSGDVFASIGNGQVQVYTSTGTPLALLNTGQGGFTTGSVSDSSGNFYVTNFSAGSVSKFDNNGNSLGLFATGLATPESILFNKTGTAYVSQVTGTAIRAFGGGSDVPVGVRTDWIDLAANQTTFYYTAEGTEIDRFDTVSGALTPFATGLPGGNAFAFRILADGDVLLADNNFDLLLNSSGSVAQTYNTGTTGMFSLDVTPDGLNFWSGSFANGELFEINIASGAIVQTISTGSGSLFGVSVDGEKTVGGGGVPEPASWALMLVGFGALGVALRSRRRYLAA
jgi:DNA-binding beta-propeller fold protein YncE